MPELAQPVNDFAHVIPADKAAAVATQVEPLWQEWVNQHFPAAGAAASA